MRLRPYLLIDVDGVINRLDWHPLYGPGGNQATSLPEGWVDGHAYKYSVRYNPEHGARLLQIAEKTGAELAWCTTWENLANEHIAPLVGLPELPFVPLQPGKRDMRFSEYRSPGHVKALAAMEFAAGRPFAWLEDEPGAGLHLKNYEGEAVQIEVDSSTGLNETHFTQATEWLLALREKASE